MSNYRNEKQQLVDDIQYLEYLIEVEKQDIKSRLVKRINVNASLPEQITGITDEISAVLAQFSARIAVIEKVLVNGKPVSAVEPELLPITADVDSRSMPQPEEVKVSIVDIGLQNGLGRLHHTENNTPFHYAAPNSNVKVEFAVNRNSKKTLAIDVVEVSEQSLLKNVVITVDGKSLKHKQAVVEGRTRLLCYLPVRSNGGKTKVEIGVPTDVTEATKFFKFCLSDVHCVPKMTLVKLAGNLLK